MKSFFLLLITSFAAGIVCSQDLYKPRDIAGAYQKGTRSPDGKPGTKYWQNKATYTISMSVAPPDRTVKGTETITYTNNSPDTLKFLITKLFLNIHKPGAAREFGVGEDYLTNGVTIDSYKVNGKDVPYRKDPYVFTNLRTSLTEPLLPGKSVQLQFEWHYEISLQSNREGMIDSTTYYLAYFFPRIAVYDDYAGWDVTDFVDSKEFYNDFCDFDVTINVPTNYIVWGTGTLQQPEKLLQPAVLKRYQQSMTSNETIHIATAADLKAKSVTARNAVNSWRFTSANIPDVAFGISDHYVWDGCSVVVDDQANRRVSAQAAYNDTAQDFHHMARFAQHALNWLSHNWPGVPYPYEKSTVFQGYADMEYPMMVNDNTTDDTAFSKFVAEHEIAHTWFPFYMGINESRYGFMDEGWATTFELLIGRSDQGVERAEDLYKQFRVNGWINDDFAGEDIPIITPANSLLGVGMGNNEYGKASLGYLAAKDLLGDELFKKCLKEFIARWNGKHPTPWDFFYSFNNVSGKDLNWFWSNWFFSNGYIDFAIAHVKSATRETTITIENKGGFFAPADLFITYSDGSKETRHLSPEVWKTTAKRIDIVIKSNKKVQSLKLDGGIFMDANTADNSWEK